IALAVSGGPDSMAMLALAAAAFPGQVHAATVDHRLRAAAAAEARMVAAWCANAGVPHTTLVVAEPIGPGSVQARARAVRYELLLPWAAEIGASCLATAHHADDQAETFLMRAALGSGVAGLAGIRARQRREVVAPGRCGGVDLV
ncbi:tRNA lysidine(34) synthetase TilS, partial [Pseudomonas canadensis]|uniref:tRNA lysidine(34) synthetase TilS n=1 Tax=Pseudomonas canadensis TaxID=915099 RepID=UPI0030DBE1E9